MNQSLQDRVDFGEIRYANCWEDADILKRALRPAPGMRFLSIASSGDNSFSLLADGATVVTADLSLAQLALVELKRAAVRRLDHEGFLGFLGIRPDSDRTRTYRQLALDLPLPVRTFWDARPELLRDGVAHCGKFERYFHTFRKWILPLVHTRSRVEQLLMPKDRPGRQKYYDDHWNTWRWRWLYRAFFNRFTMGKLGRDPEFFRFVETLVISTHLRKRTEYALTVLPTDTNPYLDYILLGNYDRTLPPYLSVDLYPALREGLDRLVIHHGTIESAAHAHGVDGFDGFNLSDIFEYQDPAACESIMRKLLDTARPGARFAYWNMMVPRQRPESLANRLRPLESLSQELFEKDRAFFYRAFIVEEVVSG